MSGVAGISQRDRRTLVVGGSVIGSLFLAARGIPAVSKWQHDRVAESESSSEELGRVRSGLRSLATLRDSLRARTARVADLDSVLIKAASPAGAAAALASLMGDVADESGFKVVSLQLRSDSAAVAGLVRVQVRLTGVADITGLAGFLRSVEGSATPMAVRDIAVSQPDPAASDAKAEALRVDVLVESLGMMVKAGAERTPVPLPGADSVLDADQDFIVSNDVFRLANAPAKVRFDPGNENGNAAQGSPPAPSLRPAMTLKAIVGGPPWQALVDGIPGQPPGTVVRAGATFDKLTARAVTRDSVIIQGPDTTWVLTFRRTP